MADEEERPVCPIVAQKRGRPLLLGSIDHMGQNYLTAGSNCILFDITLGHPTIVFKTLKTVRVRLDFVSVKVSTPVSPCALFDMN